MNYLPTSNTRRLHESNLELFRVRLTAKLCIAIVCLLQFIPRSTTLIWSPPIKTTSETWIEISLPFTGLIPIIIALEYFFYRKRGPRIIKYANIVDLILLMLFIVDWITILIASIKVQQTDPLSFQITALYGFTNFSWRTLLVTLIVQRWELKIIPPVVATVVSTAYTLYTEWYCFSFGKGINAAI